MFLDARFYATPNNIFFALKVTAGNIKIVICLFLIYPYL